MDKIISMFSVNLIFKTLVPFEMLFLSVFLDIKEHITLLAAWNLQSDGYVSFRQR